LECFEAWRRIMERYGSISKTKEFRNDQVIPIDLLWSIKHIKTFRQGTILCILFMLFVGLYLLVFYEPVILSFAVIFLLAAISLNHMYNQTLKFADVVNALNMDLTRMEVLKLNTLRFSTISNGKFTLYYDNGGMYSNPHYKVWITSIKNLPNLSYENSDLWNEDTFYRRCKGSITTPLPGYISFMDVADILSLRKIKFETSPVANRIIATLDDKWLYSNTSDILQTLKILRKIEKKLK
jgi:hypothetical protein